MRLPLAATIAFAVGAGTAAAQALPQGIPAREGMSASRLGRIDRVMQQAVDSGKVAGAVTLILRHGKVVQHGAYGWADIESGRPMREDALFRIASQSKAITTVGLMLLVEEGRIRLNDRVSQWIPSYADAQVASASDTGRTLTPVKRPITIRDLLTHTAGISYGTEPQVRERYQAAGLGPAAGFGWYFADKSEPICTSIDRLGALPLVAQPGEKWVYGYSSDILGCVIERVSGQPLDRFLQVRIFAPLGMTDTYFYPPEAKAPRVATVYTMTDAGLRQSVAGPRGQGDYLAGPKTSFSGGAGLISTARDYGRFLQMLANGGTLGATRLLSPKTVDLMRVNHVDTLYGGRSNGFGLGFSILLDPGMAGSYGSAGLYGWGGAYGSNYWIDPAEGLVAVFMTQVVPNPGLDLADRLRTLVFQAIVAN